MSTGLGFGLAALSAVLNGSFVVFSKLPSVRASGVDPLVFQMWTGWGVFLSSLLCFPFISGSLYPREAIGWGILAGGLFVVAVAFSFVAVQLVGLSVGQGIWSGSAVLISFIWGVAAFEDEVRPALAGVGLGVIIVGVVGIALCADIAKARCFGPEAGLQGAVNDDGGGGGGGRDPGAELEKSLHAESGSRSFASPSLSATVSAGSSMRQGLLDEEAHGGGVQGASFVSDSDQHYQQRLQQQYDAHGGYGSTAGAGGAADHSVPGLHASHSYSFPASASNSVMSASSLALHHLSPEEIRSLQKQRQLYGSVCALIVGVFGGSILMPLQMAPESVRGLSFVPSFGLGTLLVSPLITLPYMWLSRSESSRGNWAVRASILPGLAAGAMWNGANICSIYAIKAVGYGIAYPLMQCAIVVAALWGVLVFKEIRGRQVSVMAACAVVVLLGAIMLALSRK